MSCRTRLFLPYLLLPPSPNFCKWKLHSEGILFDYPLSFTLHILSISKLCELLLGNISIQLDLRAAPLPDPKAPLPLTWTSCKILHTFALVPLWFVPTQKPEWAFYRSQTTALFPPSIYIVSHFTQSNSISSPQPPTVPSGPTWSGHCFLSDLIHHSSPTASPFLSCFSYTALSFLPPYNHPQEYKLHETILQIIASSEPRTVSSTVIHSLKE